MNAAIVIGLMMMAFGAGVFVVATLALMAAWAFAPRPCNRDAAKLAGEEFVRLMNADPECREGLRRVAKRLQGFGQTMLILQSNPPEHIADLLSEAAESGFRGYFTDDELSD